MEMEIFCLDILERQNSYIKALELEIAVKSIDVYIVLLNRFTLQKRGEINKM